MASKKQIRKKISDVEGSIRGVSVRVFAGQARPDDERELYVLGNLLRALKRKLSRRWWMWW